MKIALWLAGRLKNLARPGASCAFLSNCIFSPAKPSVGYEEATMCIVAYGTLARKERAYPKLYMYPSKQCPAQVGHCL